MLKYQQFNIYWHDKFHAQLLSTKKVLLPLGLVSKLGCIYMYMYFPLQNQSQEDACELPEDSVSSRLTLQCCLLIAFVNSLDPDQA